MTEPTPPLALEAHGERRRSQLIRAAAFVIESEGVDAMRPPRVAEVAGCARSLVYRYFPRRDDLFVAVTEEFGHRLEQKLAPAEQAAGMQSLGDADASRPLLEAISDVIEELGVAGLILHATPRLGSQHSAELGSLTRRIEARWAEPLRASGLGQIESILVVRSAVALLTELHARDDIDRKAAIELGRRALAALVREFAPKAPIQLAKEARP
jgi:AcrR family transcriptional regulator